MELPTKLSSTETITSLGYTYTISRKVQLASKHLRNPWPPRKDSPSTLSIPETPSMPNRSRPPVSRGNVTRYRSTHQAFCTVTRVFARMTMTFAAMTAEGKPVVPGVPRIDRNRTSRRSSDEPEKVVRVITRSRRDEFETGSWKRMKMEEAQAEKMRGWVSMGERFECIGKGIEASLFRGEATNLPAETNSIRRRIVNSVGGSLESKRKRSRSSWVISARSWCLRV